MRTTRDVIVELRAEAAKAEFVLLAVGFPTETKMVSSTQSDVGSLEELNGLVAQDGHPLGFIRCTRQGTRRVIASRPLAQYADDPVPGQVLRGICEYMADSLERQYGVYAQRRHEGQEGEATV